ncbi:alpha/beta fold hydrolase [Salidesulfovibrio brasiliensis]|uniref:alpha/beta fold hydrolase n=1 Tax=Salidesulfovibrio brasiliensis TaxID=221711 RepID=UPI0006CFBD3E|nr:alpha/beta fold hydrolase [Salidesulfovibrio brasiliensis]
MKRLVIWSHGKDATPWGTKSRMLAETAKARGYEFEVLDYTDTVDPDERAERLKTLLADRRPSVLAGSSMGGYASLVASMGADVAGLFLVAPALYLPGYGTHMFDRLPAAVQVVHGWKDDVVPIDNSIRFARLHGASLMAIEGDHRLAGKAGTVASVFDMFLASLS